jgi:hypothetical protein
VKLYFVMGSANTSASVVIALRGQTNGDTGGIGGTLELDETWNDAGNGKIGVNNAANTLNVETLTFATPLPFVKGNLVTIRLDRIGDDASGDDDATGDFELLGATFIYTSNGPDGGGTFNIPARE